MNKSKQDVTVTIKSAENGVVLTCCYGEGEGHEDKQYIYKDIKKAARELPGIFSVAEAESPEETEENMDKMKSKLNKGDY